MNIKSVLRVYGQLRTLTNDETALLETLRKFTDSEREAFVEALQPPMTTRSYQKQGSERCGHTFEISGALCNRMAKNATHYDKNLLDYHKFEPKKVGGKSTSKSPRATALESQLKASVDERRQAKADAPELTGAMCVKESCGWKAEDVIHDPKGGYAGYHEFQPAEAQTASGGEVG